MKNDSLAWDDAIDAGLAVNVSGLAEQWDFVMPVAISKNLFYKYIKSDSQRAEDNCIVALLITLKEHIKWVMKNEPEAAKEDFMVLKDWTYGDTKVDCHAIISDRKPTRMGRAITIYLPEETT